MKETAYFIRFTEQEEKLNRLDPLTADPGPVCLTEKTEQKEPVWEDRICQMDGFLPGISPHFFHLSMSSCLCAGFVLHSFGKTARSEKEWEGAKKTLPKMNINYLIYTEKQKPVAFSGSVRIMEKRGQKYRGCFRHSMSNCLDSATAG